MHDESMSATATELPAEELAPIDTPTTLHRSPINGLMVIDSGRPVTNEEVADLIDEDVKEDATGVPAAMGLNRERRLAKADAIAGSLPGTWGPGYLDEIRDGWPE